MRTPDFFIVGAPKCGTTAMATYLSQHPEIFMCRKELHFFSQDIQFDQPKVSKAKYVSYFSKASDGKRLGEASVWYLYSERAASEIKTFCPHAKIIIMLRNPVDMLHSLHSQLLYNCEEDITDFEAALDAEEDRKRGLRIPSATTGSKVLFYRDVAKYAQQVQRYLNVFDPGNVHVIIFDDFERNTTHVYQQTLRFLGVNPDFQLDFQLFNPNKAWRNKTVGRYLATIPRVALRLRMDAFPSPIRRALARLYRVPRQLNTRYAPRPPLIPDLRRRLQAEFAAEVKQLGELLGRDLTHWSTEKA